MFFIFAGIIFFIILGVAILPVWSSFITDGGIKLFLENLQTELTQNEPSLPLENKTQTWWLFIKNVTSKPKCLVFLISLFSLIGSSVLYLKTGYYNFPNQPLASRLETQKNNNKQYLVIASMLTDRLEKNSNNAKDWNWLGQVLFMAEDYEQSIDAFRYAIEYGENTSETYANLGEALVMAQDGKIMADATRAFMASLRHDSQNLKAVYFLALANLQKNNEKKAIALFKQIIKNSTNDDRWNILARKHIKEITMLSGINPKKIKPMDLSVIARGFKP